MAFWLGQFLCTLIIFMLFSSDIRLYY